MEIEISDTNRVVTPLYNSRGWIKVAAVVSIISGVLTAFSIVGLLICWMQIWLGVLLYSSSNNLKKAYEENDVDGLENTMKKLAQYFKLTGIFILLSAVIGLLSAILIPAISKASQM